MDDPYSILNVYPDCTYDEAKAAYRKAALMHHPDRHPASRKSEAERRFRILANAFQQVCHELGHPIEPPEIVPSAPPPPPPASSAKITRSPPNGSTIVARVPTTRTNHRQDDSTHDQDLTPSRALPPQRRPPREELIRNREMDDLEERNPYDDDGALDRPTYAHAHPPSNAYSQDPPRRDSRPSHHDHPRREVRESHDHPRREFGESHDHPRREFGDGVDRHHYDRAHVLEEPSYDHYPAPHRSSSSHYGRPGVSSRRSSFSQPAGDWVGRREMVEHDPRSTHGHGRAPQRAPYGDRHDLYDMKPNRRDGFGGDEWDHAFTGDDFFGRGMGGSDGFMNASHKMSDLGLGFDKLMSSAMSGLSLGAPHPTSLENMGSNPNCMMRVRQSKMVMGQNQDGSWTGQKMDKQMRVGNGRMEIDENGQDIRIGVGEALLGNGRSPRHPNGRGGEDWDPPPAYEGDEDPVREEDHRRYPTDHYPEPNRRLGGAAPERYNQRLEPRGRLLDQSSSSSSTRSSGSRPNPSRGYLDDGPGSHLGYGEASIASGGGGGGGGGGGLARSQSMSQGRPQYPDGRSMVRRPDGPVTRR